MLFTFRKLFFSFSINGSLFLMLIIGIQNSQNKEKINLISYETINLPVSFIIGTSFICGSIVGFLSPTLYFRKINNFEK